jgi:hypothetical protein
MTETMGADRAADTTGQYGGGQVPAGELFTRTAVTVIMAVIALVTFAFSFGLLSGSRPHGMVLTSVWWKSRGTWPRRSCDHQR